VFLCRAALACRSRRFSRHRLSASLDFRGRFSCVETIVFGLAFLIAQLGFWPKPMPDYTLPDSLPFRGAVRRVVYAAFVHIGRAQDATVADPYFEAATPSRAKIWRLPAFTAPENRIAAASLVLPHRHQTKWKWRSTCGFPISAPISPRLENLDQSNFATMFFVFMPVVVLNVAARVRNMS